MLILIPLLALLIFLVYLYEKGIIAMQRKAAVLFSASLNANSAKFSRCTGTLTRILRFRDSAERNIIFTKALSGGSVDFEITGRKNEVLLASDEKEEYVFTPESAKRYKLKIHIKSATGSYALRIIKDS